MASNIQCNDDLDVTLLCDGTVYGTGSTVGLNSTTLASVSVPQGSQVTMSLTVSARRTDVTGTGWVAAVTGTFQNNGGTVTQIGATGVNVIDTSLLLTNSASLSISGESVIVQGAGELSKTYSWSVGGFYIKTV